MNSEQQSAILTICLMAAFADGGNDDRERAEVKRIAESLGAQGSIDVVTMLQNPSMVFVCTAPATYSPLQ